MNRRGFFACLPFAAGVVSCDERERLTEWRGLLFRIPVSILLERVDEQAARELFPRITRQVRELEEVFSQYDENSALSTLNRTGRLLNPPPALLDLLEKSLVLHEMTEGLFDPSIEGYWSWLRTELEAGRTPDEEKKREMLGTGYFSMITLGKDAIELPLRGQDPVSLTLNAVVQGYITDRVAAYLASVGVSQALVNLGEFRAIGTQKTWQVAVKSPSGKNGLLDTIPLCNRALAVSSGAGGAFTATGRENHLVNPRSMQSPRAIDTVAVLAPDATTADALATALCVHEGDASALLARFPQCEARHYTN